MMNPELTKEVRFYKGARGLAKVFPRGVRSVLKMIFFVIVVASGTASLFMALIATIRLKEFNFEVIADGTGGIFIGAFLISFAIFFILLMLTFYYNARFYRGINPILHEGQPTLKKGISYEVSEVLAGLQGDVTSALLKTKYGKEIILRCGVPEEALTAFVSQKEVVLPEDHLAVPTTGFLTLEHIAMYVYEHDSSLTEFLFNHGVTEEMYRGAAIWVVKTYQLSKYETRWWSRDNLGKINVIGKDWSYGGAYMLDRFSRDISTTAIFSILSSDVAYADEKVDEIESVLSRAKDANAILVGDQGVGKMDIVMRLGERMKEGTSSPAIVGKRMVVLDHEGFVAQHADPRELEEGLVQLFNQTVQAGNVIIVIDNLPNFLESAAGLGVNVAALVDVYLASPELQVIATTDPIRYQSHIEAKPTLVQRFERVPIESPDLSSSVRILQGIATEFERKNRIIFTYPSIFAIAESADRYLTDGVMPDKAVELLSEIAPNAARAGIKKVTKEFVYEYVSNKTGIPAGPVHDDEREKLLNLEDILHGRVIGQHNAIVAISGVMRRVRAGVQDENRPLGSFMFLGSTGVGKTETAKALAHVFFGGEEHLSRIDMSEYSGDDALQRLIGDGKSAVGSLPLLLKEKPYGVLLLDELEKATTKVHDLFLQIVDEGYFTDARGKKVNVRNNIIIATSNAGAKKIWDYAKAQENPNDHKEEIIEEIISEAVYKPEFINRFDGVIVFEPLSLDNQEKIARIMLEGLKKRIEKKGYELVIDDVLVSIVVKEGYDPEFGARPMRRVIQDIIEERIAKKIIAGNLRRGDKIWFYEEDFQDSGGHSAPPIKS